MSLLWCVPVVAAAVAAGLVASHARPLEDAGGELQESVARLGELRWRFARLRVSGRETEDRVNRFRDRHPLDASSGVGTDPRPDRESPE